MTIQEFENTRFGQGMQVKISCSGKIKDIISVDFDTNKIGVNFLGHKPDSLDDLAWYPCDRVELVQNEVEETFEFETVLA